MSVISVFPEMFTALTNWGVVGRAFADKRCELTVHNPRQFALDRHATIDDRPYGGGPGMVMQAPVLDAALEQAKHLVGEAAPVVALSPQGEVLSDALARELAGGPGLVLVAGRYEGMDERFIERSVDREVSIGDFVVSGGELPAMVLMDAVVRLLPGVLGHADSAAEDSFAEGLLDFPHYTRPEMYDGHAVPAVLLSGDHRRIARWRRLQALLRTRERRPDLFVRHSHSDEDLEILRQWDSGNRDW
nr:tRNA (guanosine(37)-N1)-methyltransferase TrmD [Luminiphilus syltensis]